MSDAGEGERGPREKLRELYEWMNSIKESEVLATSGTSDEESAAACLFVAERILYGEKPPATTSEKVLLSLQDGGAGWAETGIHRSEIPLWKKLRFTPEKASSWVRAGLTIKDGYEWGEYWDPELVLLWKTTSFSPMESLMWEKRHIPKDVAVEWEDCTGVSLWEVMGWVAEFRGSPRRDIEEIMRCVGSIREAQRWKNERFTPQEIIGYTRNGFTIKKAVVHRRKNRGFRVTDNTIINPKRVVGGRHAKRILAAALRNGWEVTSLDVDKLNNYATVKCVRGPEHATVIFRNGRFLEGVVAGKNVILSVNSFIGHLRRGDADER